MIKKSIGAVLLVLALFVFVGCNGNPILTTDEPTTETPTTETPTTEVPTTEEPTTDVPTTTEESTTEVPTTVAPTTVAPTTEVPTTQAPTTEVPTTEAPTTEAPFASELFFSEYGEGSGYNKFLEIFNGTGETVDLSNYSIQLYSNGATSPSKSVTLSGTLDNFDVFVIAHPTADTLIIDQADLIDSDVINFNGDDAITLSKDGVIIDIILEIGHPKDDKIIADVTLVRKDTISGPSINYSLSEWNSYPSYTEDTFPYLGTHADFSPTDTVLLEQDVNQLPDSVDVYGDYSFGSGSNGSVYTILSVTGEASSYVTFSEDYIISSVDEDVVYEGQIEVEVRLDGVGTTTKLIDLFLKFTTMDLRTHPEYYSLIDEEVSPEVLLLALRSLLNDTFNGVTYGEARTILAESDADPNNPDNIILVYSRASISGVWDAGSTWDREHVWPQSLLGESADNNTVNSASDLQNLKPANPTYNSSRLNKYYDNATTSNTYEPHDDVKGDVARILFYMMVMYDELTLVNTTPTTYEMALLDVLLEWHDLDPVDDFELNRNNVIYDYQGNRNPFIDNPEYVALIWGDVTAN